MSFFSRLTDNITARSKRYTPDRSTRNTKDFQKKVDDLVISKLNRFISSEERDLARAYFQRVVEVEALAKEQYTAAEADVLESMLEQKDFSETLNTITKEQIIAIASEYSPEIKAKYTAAPQDSAPAAADRRDDAIELIPVSRHQGVEEHIFAPARNDLIALKKKITEAQTTALTALDNCTELSAPQKELRKYEITLAGMNATAPILAGAKSILAQGTAVQLNEAEQKKTRDHTFYATLFLAAFGIVGSWGLYRATNQGASSTRAAVAGLHSEYIASNRNREEEQAQTAAKLTSSLERVASESEAARQQTADTYESRIRSAEEALERARKEKAGYEAELQKTRTEYAALLKQSQEAMTRLEQRLSSPGLTPQALAEAETAVQTIEQQQDTARRGYQTLPPEQQQQVDQQAQRLARLRAMMDKAKQY